MKFDHHRRLAAAAPIRPIPFFFIRLGKQKEEERKGDLSDLLARAADKTAVAGTLTALSEGDEDDETEKKKEKAAIRCWELSTCIKTPSPPLKVSVC